MDFPTSCSLDSLITTVNHGRFSGQWPLWHQNASFLCREPLERPSPVVPPPLPPDWQLKHFVSWGPATAASYSCFPHSNGHFDSVVCFVCFSCLFFCLFVCLFQLFVCLFVFFLLLFVLGLHRLLCHRRFADDFDFYLDLSYTKSTFQQSYPPNRLFWISWMVQSNRCETLACNFLFFLTSTQKRV